MAIDQILLSIFAIALLVVFGFYPVIMGLRLIRYCRSELRKRRPSFLPKVTLFVACKHAPPELEENLRSLVTQDYGDFRIVFSVAREDDPATSVIRKIASSCPGASLVIAGESGRCSEKNYNLVSAIRAHGHEADVYGFADSDLCADAGWLRHLISPLQDPGVGLTTGHPVLLPGNLWTNLALIWNVGDMSTHVDPMMSYAIGSSMAIRKTVFDEVDGLGLWDRSVSDDQPLSYAVKDKGYEIRFVPRCVTISPETFDLRGLINWSIKELQFAQFYNPPCYWGAVGAYGLNSLVMLSALVYVAIAVLMDYTLGLPVILVLLNLPLQIVIVFFILKAANIILEELRPIRGDPSLGIPLRLSLLAPLVAFVFLLNIVATFFLRTIRWSGVTYTIHEPFDVRVAERRPVAQRGIT